MRLFRTRSPLHLAGLSPGDAEALQRASDEVADHPHDLKRRRELADLCARLGRTQEAIGHYQAVVGALAAQGLLFRAIAVCKRILELDPGHTVTSTTLAALYARHDAARDGEVASTLPPAMATALRPPPDDDADDADDPGLAPAPSPLDAADDAEEVIDGDVLAAVTVLPEGSVRLERPEAVPLFSSLPPSRFTALLAALRAWEAEPGAIVVAEGERGTSVFVVASGAVSVERQGAAGPIPLAVLKPGSFFGEIALVADRPRAATVTALEPTTLLEIDRAVLDGLCGEDPHLRAILEAFCDDRLVEGVVRTSPLFADLSAAEQREVARSITPVVVDDGAELIAQGRPTPGLHIVLGGRVDVSAVADLGADATARVRLSRLEAGDVFGEMGLLAKRPAQASCRAVGRTRLARLDPDAFEGLQARLPTLRARLEALSAGRAASNARFLPELAAEDARRGAL